MNITFTNPTYLWILAAVPILIITHFYTLGKSRSVALKIANFEAISRVTKGEFLGKPYKSFFRNKNPLILLLRTITYCLFILAISGATLWYVGESSESDFVLALDASSSMLADDFEPTRLDASKEAAKLFVNTVPKAKIGIVTFSGVPIVKLRPTKDKETIMQTINEIDIMETGGTNIGDAIISSSTLLGDQENGVSDIVVLLTDGRSNVGPQIDTAIEYAVDNNIVINTIGIGTEEGGKFLENVSQEVADILVSKIDEESLQYIANVTHGKYYRAEDQQNLDNAFIEIASLTNRRISLDLSWMFLVAGLILLSLEWVLLNTRYKTIP